MNQQASFMRIAVEQPVPLALSDYEPFKALGHGTYSVSETADAAAARYEAVRTLIQQLFKRYRAIGVSPVERVRAVFFDMDATVIKQESIVELAACVGKSTEVEAITEQAMRGELDFRTSLIKRVAVLAGLPAAETLNRVVTGLVLQPGIQDLLAFCRQIGVPCFMVSGGFTAIAQPIADQLGFTGCRANVLGIAGGQLTGAVEGTIIDATAKHAYVLEICKELGLGLHQVAAVGDGANDRMMLEAVGVAVGFEPKDVLLPYLSAVTNHHAFLGPLLFGRDLGIMRGPLLASPAGA